LEDLQGIGLDVPFAGDFLKTGSIFAIQDDGSSSVVGTFTYNRGQASGPIAPVPLPSSAMFLLLGLGALGGIRRFNSRR
jgi:hypothetical protein